MHSTTLLVQLANRRICCYFKTQPFIKIYINQTARSTMVKAILGVSNPYSGINSLGEKWVKRALSFTLRCVIWYWYPPPLSCSPTQHQPSVYPSTWALWVAQLTSPQKTHHQDIYLLFTNVTNQLHNYHICRTKLQVSNIAYRYASIQISKPTILNYSLKTSVHF